MKVILTNLLILLGTVAMTAMDTGQKIFRENVRTLSVTSPDNFMAPPVIGLNGQGKLNINFDVIGDSHEYLRFRLIHCNADWQPSRLMESEYLGTFNEFEIYDYAYSSNTYIHYVNYNISLPDPEIPILASGNYLLQVFPENRPDEILLQARFSVSEDLTAITGGKTTRTDKGVNSEYQQLFFRVNIEGTNLMNPYQDILVTVTQNNNPESLRAFGHPARVERGELIFEHLPQLIYEAGNEYRRFETVKADYAGMHVDSVKFKDGLWHAWLKKDSPRKNRSYNFDKTQHGRFKIDEYNSEAPDLSADYVMVHFTFDPEDKSYGNIFLDGDFTLHSFSSENLMKYDISDGLYHASIPLKQGSYNYRYVVMENGGKTNPAPIEGNKYETDNEYLVQVYFRPSGSRADRLIGFTIL